VDALSLALPAPRGRVPFPPAARGLVDGLALRRARWALRSMLAGLLDGPAEPAVTQSGEDLETRLVAAAMYGDPDAFDRLVAGHAAALHAVARRLVGNDLASDVVQDSLLAAFRSLRRFRGEASFGSYLHGIVVNRCRRVAPRWRRSAAPFDALAAEASPEPGPEAHAVASDTRARIEAALATLPLRYRESLALREFAGLSYEEIASATGVPLGTVRSRIARARGLMRDELERRGVRP